MLVVEGGREKRMRKEGQREKKKVDNLICRVCWRQFGGARLALADWLPLNVQLTELQRFLVGPLPSRTN